LFTSSVTSGAALTALATLSESVMSSDRIRTRAIGGEVEVGHRARIAGGGVDPSSAGIEQRADEPGTEPAVGPGDESGASTDGHGRFLQVGTTSRRRCHRNQHRPTDRCFTCSDSYPLLSGFACAVIFSVASRTMDVLAEVIRVAQVRGAVAAAWTPPSPGDSNSTGYRVRPSTPSPRAQLGCTSPASPGASSAR
jgi:hypothetical protein